MQGETIGDSSGKVTARRVLANPGGTVPGGVHITIDPKAEPRPGDKGAKKPPGSKPDVPE